MGQNMIQNGQLENTKLLHKILICVFIGVFFIFLGAECYAEKMKPLRIVGDKFMCGDKEFCIWGFDFSGGIFLNDKEKEADMKRFHFLNVSLLRMAALTVRHYGTKDGEDGGYGLLPLRGSTRKLVNVDNFLKYITALKKQSIYIAISMHGFLIYPDDVDVIVKKDAEQWVDGIVKMKKTITRWLPVFDERAEAVKLRFLTNLSRLRYLDDNQKLFDCNQIAMIETVNELPSYVKVIYDKYPLKLTPYFKKKLDGLFISFLKQKYGNTKKMRIAWLKKGKTGLLKNESLEEGVIEYHPLRDELKIFSTQRHHDMVEFFVKLDLKHQKRIISHLRKLGYKGNSIFSAYYSYSHNSQALWLNGNLQPYVEDHSYCGMHNLFRAKSLVAAKLKIGSTSTNPYDYGKPYWRSEAKNSNGSGSQAHWTRVAHPLYYAVYNRLIGRDGTTFHRWCSRNGSCRDWSKTYSNLFRDFDADIPWQMVFRAAGKLFQSCEISSLNSNKCKTLFTTASTALEEEYYKKLGRTSDIIGHPQVYRNHKEGILTVKTPTFTALAVDHPYVFKTAKFVMNITSDKCNVLIAEKLNKNEYEITAVGMSGKTVTKKQRNLDFDPMTYVKGKLEFIGKKIVSVKYLSPEGKLVCKLKGDGSSLKFVDGVWLYRIKLK